MVVQVFRSDIYVDDLLSGTSTVDDAFKVQQEIPSLLQTAGFTLRKLASKYSSFLDNIPGELKKHTDNIPG